MKSKLIVAIVLALMLLPLLSGVASAGDPSLCSGLPNPEVTLKCLEDIHAADANGLFADPNGWLQREPFLSKLSDQLVAAGWNAPPKRVANAFASWKFERLYWRCQDTQDCPKTASEQVSQQWLVRNWNWYAADQEAFRQLFDIGNQVFAVNEWVPFFRYTHQFGGPW